MRKINFIMAILFLSGLYLQISAQLNEPTEKFSIVEVLVPNTDIYDDGIYRKLYSSFQIFSEEGKKLLGVPEKYDRPAKIKLPEGQYTFIVKRSNGEFIVKELTIVGNRFEVIKIN